MLIIPLALTCQAIDHRRCYEGYLVKGCLDVRWEIPVCIACCYSDVSGWADSPFNKFASQSGWMVRNGSVSATGG